MKDQATRQPTRFAGTFRPPESVEVRPTPQRGLGVFATRTIGDGEIIEEAPVLAFPELDLYSPAGTAVIANYVFALDDDSVGLTLGYGSIYNHSFSPNACYDDVDGNRRKRFVALRIIQAGEEVTINYNGAPQDNSSVGFEVI